MTKDKYDAGRKSLRDKYYADLNLIYDEYEAKRRRLADEYYANLKPICDEYFAPANAAGMQEGNHDETSAL